MKKSFKMEKVLRTMPVQKIAIELGISMQMRECDYTEYLQLKEIFTVETVAEVYSKNNVKATITKATKNGIFVAALIELGNGYRETIEEEEEIELWINDVINNEID